MARYEFVEGTSSKFWEIVLDGASFTTTYGKIGTAGQATEKSFGSEAEAKKEHDKLVAEKVKKGYVAAGGAAAPGKAAPAPAKAAKPVAKDDDDDDDAPAPPRTPGARYFEFVEGTSSKFWEVAVDGVELRTRYGKIGAAGQTTVKKLASEAAAKAEEAKLIAEKTKKGYEEAGDEGGGGDEDDDEDEDGDAGEGGPSARNPALEAAIAADPYDDEPYQIYADWLQGQGDPRGDLIALQLGKKAASATKLLAKHRDYFWNGNHAHQQTYDGNEQPAFTWKNGFIHTARLSFNSYAAEDFEGSLAEILGALVDHPSGQFLAELTLVFNGDPNEATLDDLVAILAAKPRPALRKLHIGDFQIRGEDTELSWYNVGDLSPLWAATPGLQTLIVQGGSFTLGALALPALTSARFITGGLAKASAQSIAAAKWPRIQELEIWYGESNYGGDAGIDDVRPLLARTDLRALRTLGLVNAEFTAAIAGELPGCALVPQLVELSLAKGVFTDEDAVALGAHKADLSHLAVLDVSECYLTDAGIRALRGCAKKVVADDQRDDDDPEYRSPAVGE